MLKSTSFFFHVKNYRVKKCRQFEWSGVKNTNTHWVDAAKAGRETHRLTLIAKKRSTDWHHLCLQNFARFTCENHKHCQRNAFNDLYSCAFAIAWFVLMMRIFTQHLVRWVRSSAKLLFRKTSSFDHDFYFRSKRPKKVNKFGFGNTNE